MSLPATYVGVGVPPAPPVPEPGVVSTCVTGTLLVAKVPV